MDDWKVVIPTRNDCPETLRALVGIIGAEHVVIVHTTDASRSPNVDGCGNIRYEGELNIQSWWKAGIEAAGARYIALINDDVELDWNVVPAMVAACSESEQSLARLQGPGFCPTGALFVIDTAHGLVPDVGFRWWWGDDDLYRQAEQRNGIIDIPVTGVRHKDDKDYHLNPMFTDIIAADRERYRKKWLE